MIGIAITAILSTIFGYGICAMMVVGKQADEQIEGVMCPFVFDKYTCGEGCNEWEKCNRKHERMGKK